MNVTSGGPHILLFERDQQLVTLLSGELALAGYEVHTARTAVEVFDAIARFSVRLVMVDLAQAQAGRREFWVALDAQRRGRGVQVFTFRCTNLAGYGPDDPDERVDTVATDLEVDGMMGIVQLVDAVRARVPGASSAAPSAPLRSASVSPAYTQNIPQERENLPPFEMPSAHGRDIPQERESLPPFEMPAAPPSAPTYAVPQASPTAPAANAQPLQVTFRPQASREMQMPSPSPAQAQAPRSGISTFTDKIRAVIYPGGRSHERAPETALPPNNPVAQSQQAAFYQQADVQPRPQTNQRIAEQSSNTYREDMPYQAPVSAQSYPAYNGSGVRSTHEESGLDQLSRMLNANQSALVNGNMQNSAAYVTPGLDLDQQELQAIRAQILRAAQLDEAYERSNMSQPRPAEQGGQLRVSPIQDVPYEREPEYRRAPSGPPPAQNYARPAITVLQPTQAIPPVQPTPPQAYQASPTQHYQPQVSPAQPQTYQTSPAQSYQAQAGSIPATDSRAGTQMRPASPTRELPPETSMAAASNAQIRQPRPAASAQQGQTTGSLSIDGDGMTQEQMLASQPYLPARRPEVPTSDDMLLDIVTSLPPMTPGTPAPQPPQILNGRATRSLGGVLLEGHLVPEERLQVAQHVQRMMRGVDLNYQLGEILLMFKLLTPDQLLAASLVSYGMISTTQISALGRIRQELHAMGLEYDLESLVILFRILTPEQMREVRASWSS